MKLLQMFISLLCLAQFCLGQTPVQTETPEQSKIKLFGSSLEKYKNTKQLSPQTNRKSTETHDDEVVRVKTDLAVNDILVTDQKGNIITNLKKDDFTVTEDGSPQNIEMFSSGENLSIPRSIVLIIDDSVFQAAYIKNSIRAAKLLVDKLSPNDKMAVVTVNMRLLIDFTQDKTLLKETLDSLEKKRVEMGSGNDFGALTATLNEMFTTDDRKRIIIFQGDGNEVIWLKPDMDAPYPVTDALRDESGMKYLGKRRAMSDLGFSDVKEAIEKSRTTIYSVVPGPKFLGLLKKERAALARKSFDETYKTLYPRGEYLFEIRGMFQERDAEIRTAGQTAMLKVAELSGGKIGFIEKPEDSENVYSTIFDLVSKRYSIGYYPTNQNQDGKRREVKIEVRDHPEYIITCRKTYLP